MKAVEMTSLTAYLPGSQIAPEFSKDLANHLRRHTHLPMEYIETIERERRLPGRTESNAQGWSEQPWFSSWLKQLPLKKQKDPFQGAEQRLRVPLDPSSIRDSLYPHPMLPSDAETIAGSMALVAAGIDPDSVDLLMVASQVPDRALPANSSLLQHKLGLANAGAYAVDTCCSSFVTLLELACALVRSGIKRRILIVASFIDSHVTDRSDYFSVVTGDAACAAVVEFKEDNCDFISSASSSHGSRHAGIIYERRPPRLLRTTGTSPNYAQEFTTFFDMAVCKEIAENAAADLHAVVTEAMMKVKFSTSDVDLLVTHQPVAWAPHVWRETLGVAKERFLETFSLLGNIANCCAPANLFIALSLGKVNVQQTLMLASSGAGENHIVVMIKASEKLLNAVKAQALTVKGMENLH